MQKPVNKLPDGFDLFVDNLLNEVHAVEGYLAPKEMRFLALLAAYPAAQGEILEIGSFKGKSTIILAKSAGLGGDEGIVNAVDPMTAPSETDPDLHGEANSLVDFNKNIEFHDVSDKIKLHQTLSHELAKSWDKPLRLLWIDGDHTYRGTRLDFEGFEPHLADKAIVAIHDVLHEFEGGVRVFIENILLSPNFGACGFCGSIAWAQYHVDETETFPFRKQKLSLYKKLSRLVPFLAFKKELKGIEKVKYKLLRSLVPHGAVDPQKWRKTIS